MVIVAFACFLLLIGGWFIAPSSTKAVPAEALVATGEMQAKPAH